MCAELDSHADTKLVGSNVLVFYDHKHWVDVYDYDSKNQSIKILLLLMLPYHKKTS